MDNKQSSVDQFRRLQDPRLFLRLWVIVSILLLISVALGYSFLIIMVGTVFGLLWFVGYWEPSYRILTKALCISDPNHEFMRAPLPWWRAIILIIKFAFVSFSIFIGFRILFTQGFLEQNLIYLIFSY